MSNKAIFFDRDGVLTKLVLNKQSGEYEPPKNEDDVKLLRYVIESLKKLNKAGYLLILVSNQPDYAKGKSTLTALREVHRRFNLLLNMHGVYFNRFYYCYHHPKSIIAEYSYNCECRKPKPLFLFKAKKAFDIDLENSWMVGDRDIDIECGKAAGTKTILIDEIKSIDKRRNSNPDYKAKTIRGATSIILNTK